MSPQEVVVLRSTELWGTYPRVLTLRPPAGAVQGVLLTDNQVSVFLASSDKISGKRLVLSREYPWGVKQVKFKC